MHKKIKTLFLMLTVILTFTPAVFAGENETKEYVARVLKYLDEFNPEDPCTLLLHLPASRDVNLGTEEIKSIGEATRKISQQKLELLKVLVFQSIFPQLQSQWEYDSEPTRKALVALLKKYPSASLNQLRPAIRRRDYLAAIKDPRLSQVNPNAEQNEGKVNCRTVANAIDVILETIGVGDEERALIYIEGEPDHVFNAYWINWEKLKGQISKLNLTATQRETLLAKLEKWKDCYIVDGTVAARSGAWPEETLLAFLSQIPEGAWNNPKHCHAKHYVHTSKKKDNTNIQLVPYGSGDPYEDILKIQNPYVPDKEKDYIVDQKRKTIIFGSGREKLSQTLVNRLCLQMKHDCYFDYTIIIPHSVKKIARYAFRGQEIKKIDFSKSQITKIPWAAFYDCDKLTNITFNKEIREIQTYAFSGVINKKNRLKTNIQDTAFAKQWGIANDLMFFYREYHDKGAFGKLCQRIFGLNQIKYSLNDMDKIEKTIKVDEKNHIITTGINIGAEYNFDGQDIFDKEYRVALTFTGCLQPGWTVIASEDIKKLDLSSFSNCRFKKLDLSPLGKGTIIEEFPDNFDVEELTMPEAHDFPSGEQKNTAWYWCAYSRLDAETIKIKKVKAPVYFFRRIPYEVFKKGEIGELEIPDINRYLTIKFETDNNLPSLVFKGIESETCWNESDILRFCFYAKKRYPEEFSKIKKIKINSAENSKSFLSCSMYELPLGIEEFEWEVNQKSIHYPPELAFKDDDPLHKATIKMPCIMDDWSSKFEWGNTPNVRVIDNSGTDWKKLQDFWGFEYDEQTRCTRIVKDKWSDFCYSSETNTDRLNFIHALLDGQGKKSEICYLNESLCCSKYPSRDLAKTGVLWKVFVVASPEFKLECSKYDNGKRFWDQAIYWTENSKPSRVDLQNAHAAGFFSAMPLILFNQLDKEKILSPNMKRWVFVANEPQANFSQLISEKLHFD